MFHCHTCEEECTVVDIISVTDRKMGKKKQRFAKEGSMVTAKFKVPLYRRLLISWSCKWLFFRDS